MKRRLTWSLLTLVALLALSAFSAPAGAAPAAHTRALLIGISDYGHFYPNLQENERVFQDLDCEGDLYLIKNALIHTLHCDPQHDITILNTPATTTHDAILQALQKLVTETGPGDVVFVHFSGHGDQLPDDTKTTKFASAIVPSDYKTPSPEAKTEATSNEISGRTILGYVQQLRGRHPAQVVLSFDSCHSEWAARAAAPEGKKRGLTWQEYADWYAAHHPGDRPAKARGGRMLVRGPAWDDLAGTQDDPTGYVVLAACQNDEVDTQFNVPGTDRPVGPLSYFLAQVLSQAGDQTTYRDVFSQLTSYFHEYCTGQHPQIDGDPDAKLLGGKADPPPPSIAVNVDSPGHYSLAAGQLQGMTQGSVFHIYPHGADLKAPPAALATATVQSVDEVSAALADFQDQKPGLGDKDMRGAQAVEVRHNYLAPPLTLDAASLRQVLPDQAAAILTKLTTLKIISTDLPAGGTADVRAVPADPAHGFTSPALVRANGLPILALDPTQADLPGAVYQALLTEARYRYACGLGDDQPGLNPGYHVRLEIVPTDGEGAGRPLGTRPLTIGQHFVVKVQNNSGFPLHVTVLDIDSDGTVKVRWPDPRFQLQNDDNLVQPAKSPDDWTPLWRGADRTTPATYHASSADREEIYKALATINPVDFRPLETRGTRRDAGNPFSDLFGPALDQGLLSRGTDSADPGDWAATTISFQVQ